MYILLFPVLILKVDSDRGGSDVQIWLPSPVNAPAHTEDWCAPASAFRGSAPPYSSY